MANDGEALKQRVINKVSAELKKSAGKSKGALLDRFVETYFQHAPPSDLADLGEGQLAAIAAHHLKQAKTYKSGGLSVQVFNPTAKRDGWDGDYTVIQIVNDDMPFLVDSITTDLAACEITILHLFHPILTVKRTGKAGTLDDVVDIGSPIKDTKRESFITVIVQRLPAGDLADIENRLTGVLSDVRAAVEDWRTMRQTMSGVIEELELGAPGFTTEEVAEARDFLRWIHDNHFTFLGYRDYTFSGRGKTVRAKVDPDSGLGILRDPKGWCSKSAANKAP